MDLKAKRCVPCEGNEDPMAADDADAMLKDSGLQEAGWQREDGHIEREYTAKDFRKAIGFVDKVAALAEDEGHHPDIRVHGYKHVTLTLSTHAIDGLSENDFIVAAKAEAIWGKA